MTDRQAAYPPDYIKLPSTIACGDEDDAVLITMAGILGLCWGTSTERARPIRLTRWPTSSANLGPPSIAISKCFTLTFLFIDSGSRWLIRGWHPRPVLVPHLGFGDQPGQP